MADRGDTHYRVGGLNRWFAFSSLLLLVAAVWMVLDDWSRPWKAYQREFRQIEAERARAELASPEAQEALAEEERLLARLEEVREDILTRQDELAEAEEELRQLKADQFIVTESEKKAKQEYNWERWRVEEHRIHYGEDEEYVELAKGLEELEARQAQLGLEKLDADARVATQEERLAELRAELEAVESELKSSTKDIELVRNKLAQLDPEDFPTKLANFVRDFPGLDFIDPNLRVQKVLPSDLTFELNFTRKPRVDMCQTCHVAIDRHGFEELPHPFQSHPDLDLYLSAKSPHPLNDFGCTICHRGAGEALDFQRADHRPSDEEEAERWHEEYGWHKQHYWDYPMLSSKYIEASCVQCHKSSMELIAAEAPKVAAGYQLYERYGCYACHKVEWFPTDRRPGPSLERIAQKTRPEWIQAWVADPKSFRPTTWMPQIFHLENFGPEDVIAVSEYGSGREMTGDEWSSAAVASVGAFLMERSATGELPDIPVEGDPVRGREVFRLTGCLACHNMAPYEEEEREEVFDPALERGGENEHGPNLRGIATKVSPEWLFTWIKEPHAWWSETRMPDLRLSDQDAADIVSFIFEDPEGWFHETPPDWEPGLAEYRRDVLEEQARWFFNRLRRSELEERFAGEWADDEDLLVALGEKWVVSQGCHSCHAIPGLEDAQPIGTELTTWASKTVDKLDFGFMPEILAEAHGWDYHQKQEFKQYRENFLEQKLHAPRSFDRRKVKNPTERLKMPWYDFTEEQKEAVATFVLGLVDDEVERARMVPEPEEVAMDTGLRVLRQKNCAACHVLEPGTIAFTDEEGEERVVKGQFQLLEGEILPPPLQGFHEYLADYVEWMREDYDEEFEVEEVFVQLLEPVPGLGETGDSIAISDVESIRTEPAWGGDFVQLVTDYYLNPWAWDEHTDEEYSRTGDPEGGARIQDVDGEWREFYEEPYDKIRWTYAPPVLTGQGAKVQPEWFYQFLLQPYPLREQMRVTMPTFSYDGGEAGAVADFFANRSQRDWPTDYVRRLLLELELSPAEAVAAMAEMDLSASVDEIEGILAGDRTAIDTVFPALLAYGQAVGFEGSQPVDPDYEAVPQRNPEYLEPFLERFPDWFNRVHRLVAGAEGPSCTQCHFMEGEPPTNDAPIGWAPDLRYTRERLRPDWLRRWLTDPSRIYPGTTMPANFPPDQLQWQDIYPAPSREQIEAVLTWLFNLDRAMIENLKEGAL